MRLENGSIVLCTQGRVNIHSRLLNSTNPQYIYCSRMPGRLLLLKGVTRQWSDVFFFTCASAECARMPAHLNFGFIFWF